MSPDEAKGNGHRHQFERSAQTVLLVDALHKAEDFISYADLSKASGVDVTDSLGRGALQSARNINHREHGEVWLCVRGEGMKRAAAKDAQAIAVAGLRHTRRASKRTVLKVRSLPITELPEDERTNVMARLSLLGMLSIMASEKTAKRLRSPIQEKQRELELGETLKLFGA